MFGRTRPPAPPAPTPEALGPEALAAARELAAWFAAQRDAASATAAAQMRIIWALVCAGLLAVVLLPVAIIWIEHGLREGGLDENLPPEVVTRAAVALAQLERNRDEMATALAEAEAARDAARADLDAARVRRDAVARDLRDTVTAPGAAWVVAPGTPEGGVVRALGPGPGGALFAAGARMTDAGARVLLMRSEDQGAAWSPIRLEVEGARPRGRLAAGDPPPPAPAGTLHALGLDPAGRLIAAGDEITGETLLDTSVLLLHAAEGRAPWFAVRPEAEGARLPGALRALAPGPEGALLAAGFSGTVLDPRVLLTGLADGGRGLAPITLQPDTSRPGAQRAALGALAAGPAGLLLAAGTEGPPLTPSILLLRSADAGATWTPIRPEAEGAPLRGRIEALAAAGATWLAAGSEGPPTDRRLLLLRSTDAGITWTPIRPEAEGAPLRGVLHALTAGADGTLFAAGLEEFPGSRDHRALLLRSSDDGATWTPIRLEAEGARLSGAFHAFARREGDGLLVAGDAGILWSLSAGRAARLAEALIEGREGVEPGAILPVTLPALVRDHRAAADRAADLGALAATREGIVAVAGETLARQREAVAAVTAANAQLDAALQEADPIRQVSRIATRLAVIVLLIFLVQIVLNRYRYLQRLAGFHDARARAFALMAAAGPEGAARMLAGMSVADLTAALSPDGIGFAATEAPTGHLAALLGAATRR